MKLPIGQQTRDVNGIQERGGHLYFGFDLADSANGSTLRKYYSYAELRAVPGNLDELCEKVATYDWLIATKEIFTSDLHRYWEKRSLYEARLWSQIDAALKEETSRAITLYLPDSAAKPINASANVRIVTLDDVSLYHASMTEGKAAA